MTNRLEDFFRSRIAVEKSFFTDFLNFDSKKQNQKKKTQISLHGYFNIWEKTEENQRGGEEELTHESDDSAW